MSNSSLSSFLTCNNEEEKKCLVFLLKYSQHTFLFKEEWFLNTFYRNCFKLLCDIKNKKYELSDLIFFELYEKTYQKEENEAIKLLFLESKRTEPVDVTFLVDKLQKFYITNKVIGKSEDFFAKLVETKQNFDKNQVLQKLKEIELVLNEGEEKKLHTFKDLAQNYRQIHIQRRQGISSRSIGSKEVDKYLTKPAAPQEMTCIVGRKGFGKSAFKNYLQNTLVNRGVPVISFELEMSNESTDDRIICSRSGLSLEELVKKDIDERTSYIIENEVKKLEQQKNYLRYCDPTLNLEQLDNLLELGVHTFQELDVLGPDKYFVAFFDTLDIMDDFDNASPKQIKRNVNILHRLYRKYNAHFIPILQANENKFRTGHVFKKPEELDYFHVTMEDIEGGAAFAARSRVVISINRPLQLKKQFFPERMDEWALELDLLNVHIIKQNDGKLAFLQFTFEDNFRLHPLKNIS